MYVFETDTNYYFFTSPLSLILIVSLLQFKMLNHTNENFDLSEDHLFDLITPTVFCQAWGLCV